MKKYITIVLIGISGFTFSQVSIGKTVNLNDPVNTTISLELGNATGGVKGIVLPWVTSEAEVPSATVVPGTLIFDTQTQKVKYRRIVSGSSIWQDLSAGAQTPTTPSVADAGTDVPTAKTMIGGNSVTDTTPGILVLGDDNKAMVLPRVASVSVIASPSAGMMVYVTGTANGTGVNKDQLAVYNGREWSFWKP